MRSIQTLAEAASCFALWDALLQSGGDVVTKTVETVHRLLLVHSRLRCAPAPARLRRTCLSLTFRFGFSRILRCLLPRLLRLLLLCGGHERGLSLLEVRSALFCFGLGHPLGRIRCLLRFIGFRFRFFRVVTPARHC